MQDTADRTSTPAGLAAELIKAPLRLLNLSRRQVNPLHILYLQVKQCRCGMSRLQDLPVPAPVWDSRGVAHVSCLSCMRLMTVSTGRPASHPCSCPFVDVSTSATGQIQKFVSLPCKPTRYQQGLRTWIARHHRRGARWSEGGQQYPPIDHLTLYVIVEILQGQRLALPPGFHGLSRG